MGERRAAYGFDGETWRKETEGVLASEAYVVNSIGTHKEGTWKTKAWMGDNIKIDLKEIIWGVDWIDLLLDRTGMDWIDLLLDRTGVFSLYIIVFKSFYLYIMKISHSYPV